MKGGVLLGPVRCAMQGRRAMQPTRDDGKPAPFLIGLASPCGEPAEWEVRVAQDPTGAWLPLCGEHNEHLRAVQGRPGSASVVDARRIEQ